jgi:intraflagellar transport protein 140
MQASDWRKDEQITSSIIQLYSKGKCFQQLGRFFEACAEMEIDEFGDYEKALAATEEAKNNISKLLVTNAKGGSSSASSEAVQQWLEAVNRRLTILRQFVDASQCLRQLGTKDLDCLKASLEFLHDKSVMDHGVVHAGDIYSLLLDYYVNIAQNVDKASEIIENMVKAGLKLDDYIDLDLIGKVNAMGGKFSSRNILTNDTSGRQSYTNLPNFTEDLIDEDIIEFQT